MKYKRFEDLPVWRLAQDLAVRIFLLTDKKCFDRRGDLRNQLERAVQSVSNNIAEGFERGSTAQLIEFLYYAKGSAGEVRSMLHTCDRLRWFADFKPEISDLRSMAERVSRQFAGWLESLQNTEVRGVKYLTDAERQRIERAAQRDAFLERLRTNVPHPPGAEGSMDAC